MPSFLLFYFLVKISAVGRELNTNLIIKIVYKIKKLNKKYKKTNKYIKIL